MYNPQIHHRRSIRLKGYDYSQAGLYFVTICCEDRKHRFGTIENNEMVLNEFGTLAYSEWAKLPERFTNFELDVFQLMPNHMHGIIMLNDVGAPLAGAQNDGVDAKRAPVFGDQNDGVDAKRAPVLGDQNDDVDANRAPVLGDQNDGVDANRAPARGAPTVGDIVGAYKSLVANACIEICNAKNIRLGKLWQRNYHEHIIRNEQSYQTISNYIINNPNKWKDDKFYNE